MAQYKGFVFDGINSADYGVVITGASTYSAPERAVEMFDIPGRNGALAIDQGRFANIEITYHCAMADRDQATFAQRLSALRNQLCSRYSYVRLTDDYNADEYRLALYKSGLDADLVIDRGGEFDVVFDCKPQRFLTSGESTYQIGEWGQTITETGDIVTYQGDDLTAVKSLTTDLEPIQDLHGFDSPWVGGAGKNKLPSPATTSKTVNGITIAVDSGVYSISGTATATAEIIFDLPSSVSIDSTYKTAWLNDAVNAGVVVFWRNGNTNGSSMGFGGSTNRVSPYTHDETFNRVRFLIADGTAITGTLTTSPVVLKTTETTPTAYIPYSNICPIYGRTGQTVTVTGKNLFNKNATDLYAAHALNPSTGGTYTAGSYTVTGFIKCKAGEKYITSGTGGSNDVCFYDTNKIRLSGASNFNTARTAPNNAEWLKFDYKTANADTVQLEQAASATVYEAFGTTYSRAFEDSLGNELTVYGGEDEIVGGVLTVKYGYAEFDGSENWSNVGGNFPQAFAFVTSIRNCIQNVNPYRRQGIITNKYSQDAFITGVESVDFGIRWASATVPNGRLYVYDASHSSDLAGFKSSLSSEPLQFVYPLATPLTYQLTANEVETLIGTNHVWSDAGEVTVEYGTDPYTMVNDTPFPSKPLIRVTGYGEIGFGDITITITGTAGVVTYIDCDLMECYRMSGGAIVPANQYVTFTGTDFPTIPTGKTRVTSASTISKVEVVPRWWII